MSANMSETTNDEILLIGINILCALVFFRATTEFV